MAEPTPLVSIVTPVYNAAPFLAETIASVLAQSFDRWELLLVDDGSTDASPEIAAAHAERFPTRVRVLAHPGRANRGKSSTRNLGIRAARGEYLVFLDADDRLLPDKLARQTSLLAAHPEAGMVYGRTVYWFPDDRGGCDSLSKLGVKPHRLYAPPALLIQVLRDRGSVPCLCAPMVRRMLVAEVGGFDESLQHLYEDQTLLAKLCLAAPVWVDDAAGELYRQHPGSSSHAAQRAGDYHPWLPDPARRRYLDWLRGYLSHQSETDPELVRALDRADAAYRSRLLRHVWLPLHYWGVTALASLRVPRARRLIRRRA